MSNNTDRIKDALNGFVDNAGGYDKSIARTAALALKAIDPELSSRLIELDQEGREALRQSGYYDNI